MEINKKSYKNIQVKCPFCKDKILAEALKCSHCTADLTEDKSQVEIEKQVVGIRKTRMTLGIAFIIYFIIFICFISSLSSQKPKTNQLPEQSSAEINISKDLELATNRVIRYWEEKQPESFGRQSTLNIANIVKKVSIYRNVSYDRAADLIILAFKTRDPDIIEFMR